MRLYIFGKVFFVAVVLNREKVHMTQASFLTLIYWEDSECRKNQKIQPHFADGLEPAPTQGQILLR